MNERKMSSNYLFSKPRTLSRKEGQQSCNTASSMKYVIQNKPRLIHFSFTLLVNDNVEVTNDCLIVKELTPFDFY
jgi:hypothetical protein